MTATVNTQSSTSAAPTAAAAIPATARRNTLAILVVGTIAAVACVFGPVWLVRVGLAVAVLTAVASVLMTWRQMDRLVAAHMAELQTLRDQAREVSHAHHVESMAMIERFSARTAAYKAEIAAARSEVEALRAETTAATADAEAKQTRISALNKVVADLEKKLADAQHDAAGVILLPRRGVALSGVALQRSAVDVSSRPLVYPVAQQA